MGIRATDDEQLARSLWGDDCRWDEDRGQFVPGPAGPADNDAQGDPAAVETYDGDEWSKDRLVDELRRRGLSVAGTKPELVERLSDNDRV